MHRTAHPHLQGLQESPWERWHSVVAAGKERGSGSQCFSQWPLRLGLTVAERPGPTTQIPCVHFPFQVLTAPGHPPIETGSEQRAQGSSAKIVTCCWQEASLSLESEGHSGLADTTGDGGTKSENRD